MTKTCRYCDVDFDARSPRATVCYSVSCQRRKTNDRNKRFRDEYRARHGATYNSLHYPEQIRAAARKRRALKAGATVGPPFTREDIFVRDGWVCQLCGGLIDPALQWPHLMSATEDHIVPLNRGGEHSAANVQAAHYSCNSRKRDTI